MSDFHESRPGQRMVDKAIAFEKNVVDSLSTSLIHPEPAEDPEVRERLRHLQEEMEHIRES